MPGSYGRFPLVEASPHRNRLEDPRPAYSHFIHCQLNLSNLHVDGVFLASEKYVYWTMSESTITAEQHYTLLGLNPMKCPCGSGWQSPTATVRPLPPPLLSLPWTPVDLPLALLRPGRSSLRRPAWICTLHQHHCSHPGSNNMWNTTSVNMCHWLTEILIS